MTSLILGATGLQGGAVARHMLKRNQPIRILTRNSKSPKAQSLKNLGAEIMEGNLSKQETLAPVFDGIKSIFSVQDYYSVSGGMIGELEQGRSVIQEAKSAGVKHIVQSSMGDGDMLNAPPHFTSKALLERDIIRSGLSWTLLGTVWFMDNLLNPAMKPNLIFPVLSGTLDPETKLPMLAVNDLGWIAAEALTNETSWSDRKINLAGDIMTVSDMKKSYQLITGKNPKKWQLPAMIFKRMVPEFAHQLAWHNKNNFSFGTEELSNVMPYPTNFSKFLKENKIIGL